MKNLFPQYDAGSPKDYNKIWKDATFVFDTSALLNIYRYQSATREQFIDAIEKISDRTWIPYHVALEFNINRINVLGGQNKKFSEVKAIINNIQEKLHSDIIKLQLERSHSLIDPSSFLTEFTTLSDKFLEELNVLQRSQQKLTSPDPLKQRLEDLFNGRVGDAPKSQKEIDELYKEADNRYLSRVPPGYMDSKKDKSESDEHHHLGINYKRKYGDLLIWKQILNYSKDNQVKSLIFITDDTKEDWWWKFNSEGEKTLGPRPELVEEASQVGGIDNFLMYKPDGFLENSKNYINAKISTETLEEVRDVSSVKLESNVDISNLALLSVRSEKSVLQWLRSRFDDIRANTDFFPDFTAVAGGKHFGFDVRSVNDANVFPAISNHVSQLAKRVIEDRRFDMVTIVWVSNNAKTAEDLIEKIKEMDPDPSLRRARNLVGFLDKDYNSDDEVFIPLVDLPFDKESRYGRFPQSFQ